MIRAVPSHRHEIFYPEIARLCKDKLNISKEIQRFLKCVSLKIKTPVTVLFLRKSENLGKRMIIYTNFSFLLLIQVHICFETVSVV